MLFPLSITLTILLASFGRISLKKAAQKNPPLVCAFVFMLTQTLVALPFAPWFYSTPVTFFYSLLSGALFALSMILYFWSFQNGEVSVLTPLRGLRGVVALLFSWLWWNESLNSAEALGVIIIAMGVFLLQRSSDFKNLIHFLFHKEALLTLISVVLMVIASQVDKIGVEVNGLYPHLLLDSFTTFLILGAAMLFKYRFQVIKRSFEDLDPHNILVGVLFGAAYFFQLVSLQLERVTVVNGLLPLGTLITTFLAGKMLQESTRQKWLGTSAMVLGAILLAIA